MEHHHSPHPSVSSDSSTVSSRPYMSYTHPSMLPSGAADMYHDTSPQQCATQKRHLDGVTGFEASESDSLEEPTNYNQPSTSTANKRPSSSSGPPPNGKKTKGRVKIKMEYIDNKLRRYTTFSKRKTGIMKKAYELSTLTGTQVMLLVASETGHVYTFATRKLQPMITSEAGKALIQTCLNSPDTTQPVPQATTSSTGDQRMSATGYEETELSYHIEDGEKLDMSPKSEANDSDSSNDSEAIDSIPMERPIRSSQSEIIIKNDHQPSLNKHGESTNGTPVTPLIPVSLGNLAAAGVVYHTSQGMMYSAPHSGVPNGVIFSLGPAVRGSENHSSGNSSPGQTHNTNGQQQFITIPFTTLPSLKAEEMQSLPADLSKK